MPHVITNNRHAVLLVFFSREGIQGPKSPKMSTLGMKGHGAIVDQARPRLLALHDQIMKAIPCDPEEGRADLKAMPLQTLLIHYLNWRDRFIRPRPRTISAWEGFLKHGSPAPHLDRISELTKRIAAGDDLTPYLSDKIVKFGYVGGVQSGRKPRGIEWGDKDYALNAFEAHHLHLGHIRAGHDWSGRTKHLLFVIFSRDYALPLMVGDHNSFDDGTLAEAVAEARAVEGSYHLVGVLPPMDVPKPAERRTLGRRGISTPLQVGDRVMLGENLTTAGTSYLHTYHAGKMMRTIASIEPDLDRPETLQNWFSQQGWPCPPEARISWGLDHCDLGVLEEKTRTFFRLLPWRR